MKLEKKIALLDCEKVLLHAQMRVRDEGSAEAIDAEKSAHRRLQAVKDGPAVPRGYAAKRIDEPSAMKLTPREPKPTRPADHTAPVHAPDVEWCEEVGQWVGVS